jgi:hypothetical protein
MGWKERGGVEGEVREDEGGEREGGLIHMGPNLSRNSSLRSNNSANSRLVAVKMTPRKVRGAKGRRERAEEERTRVGFVREVEVLKVSWVLSHCFWCAIWRMHARLKASQKYLAFGLPERASSLSSNMGFVSLNFFPL